MRNKKVVICAYEPCQKVIDHRKTNAKFCCKEHRHAFNDADPWKIRCRSRRRWTRLNPCIVCGKPASSESAYTCKDHHPGKPRQRCIGCNAPIDKGRINPCPKCRGYRHGPPKWVRELGVENMITLISWMGFLEVSEIFDVTKNAVMGFWYRNEQKTGKSSTAKNQEDADQASGRQVV